jgi:hypothetical protein
VVEMGPLTHGGWAVHSRCWLCTPVLALALQGRHRLPVNADMRAGSFESGLADDCLLISCWRSRDVGCAPGSVPAKADCMP